MSLLLHFSWLATLDVLAGRNGLWLLVMAPVFGLPVVALLLVRCSGVRFWFAWPWTKDEQPAADHVSTNHNGLNSSWASSY
jgi:hypothetical protein